MVTNLKAVVNKHDLGEITHIEVTQRFYSLSFEIGNIIINNFQKTIRVQEIADDGDYTYFKYETDESYHLDNKTYIKSLVDKMLG